MSTKAIDKKNKLIFLTAFTLLSLTYSTLFLEYTEKSLELRKINKQVETTTMELKNKEKTLKNIETLNKKTKLEKEELIKEVSKSKQESNVLKTKESVLESEVKELKSTNDLIEKNIKK